MATQEQPTPRAGKRVIKRYSNRKLYDTKDSRYVTLQQVGEMVRAGEDVQIIDNKTKEDKTEATLALILSEDLKSKPRGVPLGTLRTLIQERGERLLSSLRTSSVGRLIGAEATDGAAGTAVAGEASPPTGKSAPVTGPAAGEDRSDKAQAPRAGATKTRLNELVETSRHTLVELQAALDERVRTIVPGMASMRELRAEIEALSRRVEALERKLGVAGPEAGGE